MLGANSDVLVAEGGFLYMRQKKMTPELEEVPVEVLSSKGAQDVGLHVFSTSGLLDGSWYNRTFWMYSQRWPGFQLANQAPKSRPVAGGGRPKDLRLASLLSPQRAQPDVLSRARRLSAVRGREYQRAADCR